MIQSLLSERAFAGVFGDADVVGDGPELDGRECELKASSSSRLIAREAGLTTEDLVSMSEI